tara:strand:+ start:272 stop:418 length:147 start_codon:yes stop_codon:yes gene_type:complete
MLENILELLRSDDWIGYSKNIDIAKGFYKIPKTKQEKKEQLKRQEQWQ